MKNPPNHALSAALLLLAGLPLAAWADAPLPPSPAATTVVPVPTTAPAMPVTLRYKFVPGQMTRYKMTVDTNGTISLPTGTRFPLKQHMEMILRQTVQSVNAAGAATVATALESVTGTMNGRPLPPQATQGMQKEMGTMTLTPTGKVLALQAPTMPGGMPGMDMNNLSQTGTAFPDGPINVGDTWKNSVTTGLAGMKIQAVSTLSSVDTTGGGNVADIAQTLTGTFNTPLPSPPVKPGAPAVPTNSLTGTLTGNGTLKFDVSSGRVVEQTNASEMQMTLATKPPAAAGMPPPPTLTKMHFHVVTDMQRLPDAAPLPAP